MSQGCPDSSGEERVPLPFPYSSHNYKIRVSTYKSVQRSVSACSPKFEITAREHPEYSTPTPVEPGLYIKRQPDPRTRGKLLPATVTATVTVTVASQVVPGALLGGIVTREDGVVSHLCGIILE